MVTHVQKISAEKHWQRKINEELYANPYFLKFYIFLFFPFPVPYPETNPKILKRKDQVCTGIRNVCKYCTLRTVPFLGPINFH